MKGNFLTMGFVAVAILTATGCDAFRSLAGRPTSEDIEAKREQIVALEAFRQARQDSIRLEQELIAKYNAAQEAVLSSGLVVITPESIRSLSGVNLDFKYALMLGSFKMEENAEKLSSRIREKGYDAALVKYNNGSVAVGAAPTSDPVEFFAALNSLREDEICPEDAWILFNE